MAICFLIICFLLLGPVILTGSNFIGINYGEVADHLPSPEDVAQILRLTGIKKLKLYNPDPFILRAFANSNFEFAIGLPDESLANVSGNAGALAWVQENVKTYHPATKITMIIVGNEILTSNNTSMMKNLLPAMQGIREALVRLSLDKQVNVTTTHSLALLQTSYPPAGGQFRPSLLLDPILRFLNSYDYPFWINAYPYFAYKANPAEVSLDFALLQPDQGIMVDSIRYDNMLYAQLDAVYSALRSSGYPGMSVQISETGWPSEGDKDEVGASLENAQKYILNLVKLVTTNKGTPLKPSSSLDVYVFSLFNEDMKPGPKSERNYGLFKQDGNPAYNLPFRTLRYVSSRAATDPPAPTSNVLASGYLNVSPGPVAAPSSSALVWWHNQLLCIFSILSTCICSFLL